MYGGERQPGLLGWSVRDRLVQRRLRGLRRQPGKRLRDPSEYLGELRRVRPKLCSHERYGNLCYRDLYSIDLLVRLRGLRRERWERLRDADHDQRKLRGMW